MLSLSLLAAVSGQSQTNAEGSSPSPTLLLPMAIPMPPTQEAGDDADDDYIDMELNISSSSNHCRDPRDFEFQMSSSAFHTHPTSTADQLFYNGRLLPLHNVNHDSVDNSLDLDPACLKAPSTAPTTSTSTPLVGSRNISPSQSCRVSCELNPEEYFFEWSTEIRGFIHNRPHDSWSQKMRKSSSLCQRLRSSGWTFLKSLFTKPGVCAKAAATCNAGTPLIVKDLLYAQYVKVEDRSTCKLSDAIVRSIERLELGRVAWGSSENHRRSFSGAIRGRKHSGTNKSGNMNSSSGSSSSSSSSFSLAATLASPKDLPLLRSSSSANSEIEREISIEGAIAHCKQSHSQPQHYFPNHPTRAVTVTQSWDESG